MKKLLLLILTTFLFSNFNAQEVDDLVYVQSGYTHQSYYSMSNGEVANVINTDWDIAFEADAFGVGIRINGQIGTQLFMFPDGSTSDWDDVDTTDMNEWQRLYDADTYWYEGAFNRNLDAGNAFDYGWGIYNPITHQVIGDSLYVIKLSDNSYRKLWIESMINNEYAFKFADVDGENETSVTIDKGLYSSKNFVYYSFQTEEIIDREPDIDTYDLVFTKYEGVYSPGVYYNVTGGLHNKGVRVAQADDVNTSDAIWSQFPLKDTISTIGWDWKVFNNSTFAYDIIADRCYFVEDLDSNIWKITFTSFAGSSTGEIGFTKEQVGTVGIDEQESINAYAIFPNPAENDFVNVQFNSSSKEVMLNIIDLTGKLVYTDIFYNQNNQNQQLNISDLNPGLYIISLQSGNSRISKKLIVK